MLSGDACIDLENTSIRHLCDQFSALVSPTMKHNGEIKEQLGRTRRVQNLVHRLRIS